MLVSQILHQEPLLGESKRAALAQMVERLAVRLAAPQYAQYSLFKVMRPSRAAPPGCLGFGASSR